MNRCTERARPRRRGDHIGAVDWTDFSGRRAAYIHTLLSGVVVGTFDLGQVASRRMTGCHVLVIVDVGILEG